jgi:outer membrane receptor protein involved in Fe transport
MTRYTVWMAVLSAALVLAPARGADAQTTGRIFGTVADSQKATVPGATVTVSGPALQGTQTQVTDGAGAFHFPALPPGLYTARVTLSGFKTISQSDISLRLDQTVTLSFTLEVAAREEVVTVTAAPPAVDTTSTVAGFVAGAEVFNRLAGSRDFYAVTRLAPGAATDAQGPTFYGSSSAENQYIIEGLNTTGIKQGTKGKTLNSDFVQEVEIKTGGLPAEYGRMTGGVVNVVTKSGGNTVRGSVFGFYKGGGLSAKDSTTDKRPTDTTTVTDLSGQWDTGAEVGGFIIKDRVWFFGAINRDSQNTESTLIRSIGSPGSPAIGSVIPTDRSSNLWAAKLTWSPAPGHTLNLSAFGDPTTTNGAVFPISGPESTWMGGTKTGGNDVVGRYDGVVGRRLVVQGLWARHREKQQYSGPGRDLVAFSDLTVDPNAYSGGFPAFQDLWLTRDVLKGDVTWFWNRHEVKAGADYEHLQAVNDNYDGGAGQLIDTLVYDPDPSIAGDEQIYYRHRFFIDDRAPGYNRDDPATWRLAVPLTSKPDSRNASFYVQDSWKAAPGLTLNVGLRWEYQDVRSRDRVTAFSLKDNWAPRVGVIYDVVGNGRSKLYANWGRFYESVPMDINIRAFGGEVQCYCNNFDPSPAAIAPDDTAPLPSTLYGGVEPVDPHLKGQYMDEFLVGYEQEVAGQWVLGAKFTDRRLGRVIEDFFIIDEGNYFIANPGEGIGTKVTFYDGSTANAPRATRTSRAFEVTARKRFADHWQFMGSAVFSTLEGNYDGTFQVSTGQLDPNINSAFDFADLLVNADGRLSNNRNVQLKADGSYEFSEGALRGLNLGASFHWLAGTPLNAYGYSFFYGAWEYYLAPRGSMGRGPANWEADAHVSYPIAFGSKVRLNLIADIFNVFNRQATTALDQRYNLISDGACGGVPAAICNVDGGLLALPNSLDPVGSITRSSATNPDYLRKGVGFTGPFSIRLGARLMF